MPPTAAEGLGCGLQILRNRQWQTVDSAVHNLLLLIAENLEIPQVQATCAVDRAGDAERTEKGNLQVHGSVVDAFFADAQVP